MFYFCVRVFLHYKGFLRLGLAFCLYQAQSLLKIIFGRLLHTNHIFLYFLYCNHFYPPIDQYYNNLLF